MMCALESWKEAQQAASIAVRGPVERVQVCLIRRKDSKRWGIPKGLVDPGETHADTALKEAWEEAGLMGRLLGEPIGTYQYRKWATDFTVAVFLMEVHEAQDDWQEAAIRDRKWTSFDEAGSLLADHPVRSLLTHARELLTQRLA
jgi:phosphohistidine phosphatase